MCIVQHGTLNYESLEQPNNLVNNFHQTSFNMPHHLWDI